MAEERAFKRSELYELVWAKPVRTVAADIGVSDVAVAKACRKHKIPLPGRGSWALRQHGYKVKQTPLPPLPGGSNPIIVFHANRQEEPAEAQPVSPELEVELRPENRIVVPETLDRIHRTVRHTRATLRKHKPDEYGLLRTWAKDCFNIKVSQASLERALRILDAVVRACEARGHTIVEGDEPRSGLRFRVQDELLNVSLSERVKRVTHVVTEREELRQELDVGWKPAKFDWQPTGTLTLRIANGPMQRCSWRGRAKEPLEQRLNEFVAGLAESARVMKENREAAELRRRQWEEEEKKREERRRKQEVERVRFKRLERQARLWRRRETVQAFLDAVKERMKEAREDLVPAAKAWVEWAEGYLDHHRPVDVLFFERLLDRDTNGFYHWTGGFGERDEWVDEWGY